MDIEGLLYTQVIQTEIRFLNTAIFLVLFSSPSGPLAPKYSQIWAVALTTYIKEKWSFFAWKSSHWRHWPGSRPVLLLRGWLSTFPFAKLTQAGGCQGSMSDSRFRQGYWEKLRRIPYRMPSLSIFKGAYGVTGKKKGGHASSIINVPMSNSTRLF